MVLLCHALLTQGIAKQVPASGSLGVTQKAAILGLCQTGHPEGTTDYHRRWCIVCRRSSYVEQFVVIDTECTFVACVYSGGCANVNFSVGITTATCARCWSR